MTPTEAWIVVTADGGVLVWSFDRDRAAAHAMAHAPAYVLGPIPVYFTWGFS